MTTAHQILDTRSLKFGPLLDRALLADFSCGERDIDRAIEKCFEWQDRDRVRLFSVMSEGHTAAHGFYALGMSATETKYLSGAIIHSAEDRAYVPFIYLNYIAMREEFQNQKVGTMLLMNALTRCAQVARNIGVYGVALNALTERAGSLYERFGFRAYDEKKFPLMILPARSLFELIPAPKA